ncbi:N-methylhydantoinase A [Thalassobaculum fulvum]|uniref:N-methylhydantoinase A n=1 Tax=Thalassobaculum fulvum TaxID=1633335 RepID=A0A919CPT6_9PROT|nr:hydantoinase B/oxoprolinase family protein [Thalassobaculum fulvum]GHD44787.1 N-methylhydantoinase A [Thalassobaculum fulvum]
MASATARYRIGFDIGGTFTDFVLLDEDDRALRLHKCLTTPADPSVGALQGMRELLDAAGLSMSAVGHVVHGTTLATNAIIERKGARLGLLTTRGFRDILEMGTEQRYDIHDLFLTYPDALAPRRRRREIDERVDRDGRVVTPVDLEQVRAEVRALLDDGAEAIAVCFIHAYANPAHERAVRDLIRAEFPGVAVSASSDVHPQIKEYERSSTTAANAYVQPLMSEYVAKLSAALADQGFTGRFHLIQSSGGLTAPETAAELPIRFLESGPAGGAQATGLIGRAIGHPDVLSFDMGGTTAKAALIQDGEPDIAPMLEAGRVHRFKKGSGIPVFAPVIDMIEIGAGGGSIARVDDLGLLKVGPDSAGADPGPACYGAGGTQPTVTDANLLLGYLDPGYFLGGRMSLDVAAAEAAVAGLAGRLGLSTLEAAWGIYDLVSENMAGAARVHIVEKGRDPRGYAMVAMGGAGPLHAARVARKLGMREVVVPPASGAASALGFLGAPVSYEMARSFPVRIADPDYAAIEAMLAEMEAEGRQRLADAGAASGVTVQRKADMRLRGQMHELSVTMPGEPLSPDNLPSMVAAFTEEYQRRYTHLYDGAEIEVLNWRVVCTGPAPELSTRLAGGSTAERALKGHRKAWVPERGEVAEVPVYDRYSLRPGETVAGPAIVEEREATTIVPDACTVRVDEQFNLRLSLAELKAGQVLVGADTALDDAIARIEADPVGLEIMWSRLINVAEECWHTVIRTAFSLIIGEAQDFACEILDADGKQIVHSPRAMPVFNLTLPIAVNAMIERFPPETLEPGDVLVTNDPWLCAGHLFDIAVAVPVFREGRVVAFVGVVGHVSDIGGTKDSLNAREIYDEGFQIPPMKLFRAGKPNEDLLELFRENVRRPDQVLGDLHALVASGMTGAERIGEFMEEYGMHDLKALAAVVQRRAEAAMRQAIRSVPDGIYEHIVQGDGLDQAMTYPIQVSIQGDRVDISFDGAPPQMDRGGSNCTLTYTKAHATYPLKCIFSPDVPGNAGCYRPMGVDAPAGSILNCDRPLSVNMRTRTGWYIAPNVFGALADAAPDRVQAFTGLPSSALFYGIGPDGIVYSDHLFQGGGQGASAHGDGKSALLYPTSAANTSVELFETRVPALVLEKALMVDSGGPGRKRGGLGQVVSTRKLQDDGRPCQVGIYPNGVLTRVQGLFGGKAGAPSAGLVGRFGETPRDVGVGALSSLTGVDQFAELRISGGSGFGDPLTRGYDEVQADLDEGYVTPEGARRDYGCIVGADGRIDRVASDRLRKGEARETEPAE